MKHFSDKRIKEKLSWIKARSKKKNVSFNVTFKKLDNMLNNCNECIACGKKYVEGLNKRHIRTIDRVNPSKGYTNENIQIICGSCNSKKFTKIIRYKKGFK